MQQRLWNRAGKRICDVLVAGMSATVCLPLVLVACLIVYVTSGRPIFFAQERAGLNGVAFRVWKIRSMCRTHVHNPDAAVVIGVGDAEVLWAGRWLRRFKIDELPQLWNVLNGEMSLIGPRPTVPEQVDKYDGFGRQRLSVRPGLTGLAQVNGNAAIPWEERIRYDVYYVHNVSFAMDLFIMFKTVLIVALGEELFARRFDDSRYGNSEGTSA